jgi:hypothetical protein
VEVLVGILVQMHLHLIQEIPVVLAAVVHIELMVVVYIRVLGLLVPESNLHNLELVELMVEVIRELLFQQLQLVVVVVVQAEQLLDEMVE